MASPALTGQISNPLALAKKLAIGGELAHIVRIERSPIRHRTLSETIYGYELLESNFSMQKWSCGSLLLLDAGGDELHEFARKLKPPFGGTINLRP